MSFKLRNWQTLFAIPAAVLVLFTLATVQWIPYKENNIVGNEKAHVGWDSQVIQPIDSLSLLYYFNLAGNIMHDCQANCNSDMQTSFY